MIITPEEFETLKTQWKFRGRDVSSFSVSGDTDVGLCLFEVEYIESKPLINIPFDGSLWTLKMERLSDDSVSVSLHWNGKEIPTHSTVLSDDEFYKGFQHLVNWINN